MLFDRACFTARNCTCVEGTMKQLCLGIIVAIGLTLPAFGQGTLKEQLVGAWALVSCASKEPWCSDPNGNHILDSRGHYPTINASRGPPQVSHHTKPRKTSPPEEHNAVAAALP